MQIRRDIQGISANMLSKELRGLEMNLLVKRIVHDSKPVTVEYAITEHGKTFIPVVEALIKWGIKHRKVIKSNY
jgi:DNA-binding HxlR family transcriptional regulator